MSEIGEKILRSAARGSILPIYILFILSVMLQLRKVMYQPNTDNDTVQEHRPWLIGAPVQISRSSRIAVNEGPICSERVQYD
ncbi:hypothetical protein EDB80DRAFT_706393 [Ilyonectria destructans]|nr:hypothetical protein EDB80DRAFT_706393 [Ilyonectria destructans]